MKVAIIHSDKYVKTGAHHINSLVHKALENKGVEVEDFYPKVNLIEHTFDLKGIANMLFFYSLLEQRNKILKHDIIQGTTYTPLAFLSFNKPIICHFGSSSYGFIKATPQAKNINHETKDTWYKLCKKKITHLNIQTRRPLRDIAEIEKYTAQKAEAIIASSNIVKSDLISLGVSENKIHVIHNAIEDYWFNKKGRGKLNDSPQIVFLNRLGDDPFTWKLKGLDRLIQIFCEFKDVNKSLFIMSNDEKIHPYLKTILRNTDIYLNQSREEIKEYLDKLTGSIIFLSSRYEGFSLSVVEAMSQGLIPVAYPVGIIPEIIKNGENGFIVNSQRDAKTRIKQLLKNSTLRRKLAGNAQITSRQFRAKKMGKELISLYKQVLKTSKTEPADINSSDESLAVI